MFRSNLPFWGCFISQQIQGRLVGLCFIVCSIRQTNHLSEKIGGDGQLGLIAENKILTSLQFKMKS